MPDDDAVLPPGAGTARTEADDEAATPAAAADADVARRTRLIAAAGAVIVVLLIGALMTRGSDDAAPTTALPVSTTMAATSTAPPAPTSTATVPTTAPEPAASPSNTHVLPGRPYLAATARRPGAIAVFAAPNAPAASQSLSNPIVVSADQPGATVPLVVLVRQRLANGWLEVFLPVRPNGSTGFVREADFTTVSHNYRIEVRLGAFNLKAFDGDRVILDAPIAQAADNTPTPGGLYYLNMLLKPPDPNTAYGTYAYGLSGYSDTLQSFNGGPGQLGIHGTNEPQRMGQKVSHGCIRLRNQDIEKLVPILPLGVPVLILA